MRTKLKRPPLILENGFESWDLTYPMYTKCIEPQVELTFEDRFGKLLADAIQGLNFFFYHYVKNYF